MLSRKLVFGEELLTLENLEEEDLLNESQLRRKCEIQTELMHMLEEEESYWNKRSNSKWLLNGDNNTEFFYRVANGRKRKNTIFYLQQDDKIIKGDENLFLHSIEYYEHLFGPRDKPLFHFDAKCWSRDEKNNEEVNAELTRPFHS